MRVLLFGGTSEGRQLAEWLDVRGTCEVVACSATEYGGELVSGLEHVHPIVGPLDDAAKEELVEKWDFDCIVDATHPFATHVTESVAELARRYGIPRLRVIRCDDAPYDGSGREPGFGPAGGFGLDSNPEPVSMLISASRETRLNPHPSVAARSCAPAAWASGRAGARSYGKGGIKTRLPSPNAFMSVADIAEAARYVAAHPGNILLTTGAKDLAVFTAVVSDFADRLFVRVLPVADSVSHARALGIPASHIVAMQGPFSVAFNSALIHELSIDILVTKASGAVGGLPEKLEAAWLCGAQAVVIDRPKAEEGVTLVEAKRELEVRYGA